MDFAGEQYYRVNRFLLLCLGLWPYQNPTTKRIQVVFFQTLYVSLMLCQLSAFAMRKYSIDVVIKIFTYVIFNLLFIVKYNGFLLLTENIRYLVERIRYDWSILRNQAELKIIRGYASNARLYTIFYISYITAVLLGYIVIGCTPDILNTVAPLNESRPRRLLTVVEYFVDQEKHFYVVFTHLGLVIYAGLNTIAAIGTILIAYVLHTCALFKIASYRIEHIFDQDVLQKPRDIRQRKLCEKLIHAVYIHRRAIELANIMTNNFATYYFVLLAIGLASTSFSLIGFLHAAMSLDDGFEVFISINHVCLHLYYIFLGNYVGQRLIDTSIDIHRITYDTYWYVAPLWMQKLLLFIMQRSNRNSSLIAGGLFQASLEGFATIMSMSVSYVMVIHSMQQNKPNEE